MYHVQVPPPAHTFNPNIPGISWVDLVFPFFLFSMGAAFPFSLTKQLNEPGKLKIYGRIIFRGLQLMAFALIIYHIRPYALAASPGMSANILAISLFVLLFIIFLRFPDSARKEIVIFAKSASLLLLVLFLALYNFPAFGSFSFRKFDIIILVLSNVAIAGSVIWIITKGSDLKRILVLALMLGIRISYGMEGTWVHDLAKLWPSHFLFQFTFLKYLFIIIPGMITGDILMDRSKPAEPAVGVSLYGYIYAIICFALNVLLLIGMYNRWLPQTILMTCLLLAAGYTALRLFSPDQAGRSRRLFNWGAAWLLIGLFFEPYEGGIKKDPSTVSYYLITSGLAIFMLEGFFTLFKNLKIQRAFGLLTASGKNPMLAYAAGTNLLTPLAAITGLNELLLFLLPGAWPGVLRGVILTLLLAVIVSFFTKKGLFWRT